MTSRLVGRDPALAMAGSALSGALDGTGRLLLVGGEPGIGKTALARSVADDARRAGARVVWSACSGGAPAYWPWTQVLRELAESRLVLSPRSDDPDDPLSRFELHDSVARAIGGAARDTPLVVVIDDLHWADEGSLELLDSLARGLGGRSLLVLGTYRDLESPASLTRIAASVDGITLGGLDAPAVLRLVTTITGTAPSAADAEDLTARTGGNPLFVREVARLLVAHGTGRPPPAQLPKTVAETLRRRLAALGDECRDLLTVVAIADDRDPTLLAAVTSQEPGALETLVDEAVMARVLRDAAEDGGHGPFVHDLFREAVLADVPPRHRRRVNAAVGRALVELVASRHPAGAGRVAAHLIASLPGDEDATEAARTWAVRAAEEATGALGHEEAVRWYRAALSIAGRPDAALTLRLGEAELRAGEPQARATFLTAADEARTANDAPALAAAALGLHRIGARVNHDEHLALLDEAIAAVDRGSVERARLLAALARERRHARGSATEARVPAEEAVAEAQALGDPRLVAECLLALHDALWEPGSSATRLPVVEQMAAAAGQADDAELLATATVLRAACLISANDPRGLADLATYAELTDALGHARGRWESMSRRATLALITGALDDSADLAGRARDLGLRMGIPDALGVYATLTWSLARLTGRREAEVAAMPAIDILPMRSAFAAVAAREGGRHDEARRHALTLDVGALANPTDLEFEALVADALVAAGPTDAAKAAYSALFPFAGTNVLVGGCASYWGPVDLYLGELATGLGDRGAALEHLRSAERMATVLGAPLWAAHAAALASGLDGDRGAPSLARDGAVWTVRWDGLVGHVPDSKGLRDLELLIARPGTQIAAGELMSGRPTAGADPVLDEQAKRAYRQRLDELAEEIEDALATADAARAERAQDERDALIGALASAVGLGGRDRRLGDDAERARKAVTARIRDAIKRIDEVHPSLGSHLGAAVQTGAWCAYRPGGDAG